MDKNKLWDYTNDHESTLNKPIFCLDNGVHFSVAETFGTVTPLQALASIPEGGIATLGATGTAIAAGANIAINTTLGATFLEAGISIGSIVNSIPVYGSEQSVGDWWADYIWDLLNDEDNPCP